MRARGLSLLEAIFLVAIVGLAVSLLSVTRFSGQRHHLDSKCANNLKQIGLAAMQYADDKRFFPHRGALDALDGGVESDTAARCMRALIHYNYCDAPEAFVCPASLDVPDRLDDEMKKDIRNFHWEGANGPQDPITDSPLYNAKGAGDRPLTEMTDLSYGWTRRGYSGNARASTLLAGDKARVVPGREDEPLRQGNMAGNHVEAIHVVYVDAHVGRVKPDADPGVTTHNVADTTQGGGFLGVLGD